MGNIASGIASQLCMIAEGTASYGSAPSLTSARFFEFNSETLELTKNTVQGQGLHGGGLYDRASRRVITSYAAKGGVSMDLPTQGLSTIIPHMIGSFGTSLTQNGSTGTYSATYGPGSLYHHSLCIQKGVPAVDTATVEPFTYVGGKVTDWTVSVALNAIVKFDLTFDFRNELAGSGNGDPVNTTVPALQAPPVPYTPATNGVFHFREASLLTGGSCTTTSGVTTYSGGSVAGNVTSAEIKHAVKLKTDRIFLGSAGFKAEQLENGFRSITGQFVIEWLNSEAMYNAFSADTATCLELSLVGLTPIATGVYPTLNILIPQIRLDGDSPKVSGPDVVEQTVPFTGLDDDVNNQIQISYTTLDAS